MLLFSTNLFASELEFFCNHQDPDIAYTARQIANALEVEECSQVIHEEVVSLDLEGTAVVNLMPLMIFTNLQTLNISFNSIDDITPLENLIHLTDLNISENVDLENLSPLTSLLQLKVLKLNDNKISDLTPLANLINLESLSFLRNRVKDISPLKSLFSLKLFVAASNLIIFDQQHCPTGADIAPLVDRFCQNADQAQTPES